MGELAPLRVAVISRYALVRAGLTHLVHTDTTRAVVIDTSQHDGQVRDADVVLYDLASMTADENEHDLRHLLAGRIPVVGLARDGRQDLADGAKVLGVGTIVPEDVSSKELLDVLEDATGRAPERRPANPVLPGTVLTERERDVLRLLASGMSNVQIADEMYLSINTVKTYVRSAYKKIHVTSRSGAVLWAIQYNATPVTIDRRIEPPG
jgi:DNA-binding NarL/FixJ family response regulator